MIQIRQAMSDCASTFPAIERSAAEAFRTFPALSYLSEEEVKDAGWHEEMIAAGTCWVAVAPQFGIVGFLSAQAVDRTLHVRELSVCRDYQGQGIGGRLMVAALEGAVALGLIEVTLTTFREVPWNAPFYKRLGFELLNDEAAGERLGRILAEERALGLTGGTRCAMKLSLDRLS
jgi:GNAT superfamily N-acetyltransferase